MSASTPPNPAAVRVSMRDDNVLMNDAQILRDHIRAIAQEMRSVIPHGSKVTLSEAIHASVLNSFADKLEGKQNENT